MIHLIYLACGEEPAGAQVQDSVDALAPLLAKSAVRVHLYADEGQAWTPRTGVTVHRLTPETIHAWAGHSENRQRLKLAAILETAAAVPRQKLLALDPGWVPTGDVAALAAGIAPGRMVLQRRQGPVGDPELATFRRLMLGVRLQDRTLPLALEVWGTGVIGLDPADVPLLYRVLACTDQLSTRARGDVTASYALSLVAHDAGIRVQTVYGETRFVCTPGKDAVPRGLPPGSQVGTRASHGEAPPPVMLQGCLSEIELPEILQVVSTMSYPCRIILRSPTDSKLAAEIHLREGRVVECALGDLRGSEAFFRLLTWQSGQFEVRRTTAESGGAMNRELTPLLLEGLARMDEACS